MFLFSQQASRRWPLKSVSPFLNRPAHFSHNWKLGFVIAPAEGFREAASNMASSNLLLKTLMKTKQNKRPQVSALSSIPVPGRGLGSNHSSAFGVQSVKKCMKRHENRKRHVMTQAYPSYLCSETVAGFPCASGNWKPWESDRSSCFDLSF